MRILAVGDTEAAYLWDYYEPGRLDGIDLILSAGDLGPHYLSFLATFCRGPVLYVRGNHDDKYQVMPPEGCICVEDTVYVHKGLRIAGLGGCLRYSQGDNQFTERQMERRVARLRPRLRKAGGCDILLTHAPAAGLNEGADRAHEGFQCFLTLIDAFRPAFFVHAHVHRNYGDGYVKHCQYNGVQVINAYERQTFELDAPAPEPTKPAGQGAAFFRQNR